MQLELAVEDRLGLGELPELAEQRLRLLAQAQRVSVLAQVFELLVQLGLAGAGELAGVLHAVIGAEVRDGCRHVLAVAVARPERGEPIELVLEVGARIRGALQLPIARLPAARAVEARELDRGAHRGAEVGRADRVELGIRQMESRHHVRAAEGPDRHDGGADGGRGADLHSARTRPGVRCRVREGHRHRAAVPVHVQCADDGPVGRLPLGRRQLRPLGAVDPRAALRLGRSLRAAPGQLAGVAEGPGTGQRVCGRDVGDHEARTRAVHHRTPQPCHERR